MFLTHPVIFPQGSPARILETRKTVPGLRVLDKWAVLIGGGQNHRMGLYDMIMIKDNHIAAAGGITAAVHGTEVYPSSLQSESEKSPGDLQCTLPTMMEPTVGLNHHMVSPHGCVAQAFMRERNLQLPVEVLSDLHGRVLGRGQEDRAVAVALLRTLLASR